MDDEISNFFYATDMDGQRAKQKAFLTMAFGDPNEYSGADLRAAHEKLVADGLNDIPFSCRNGICLTCMMRVRAWRRSWNCTSNDWTGAV